MFDRIESETIGSFVGARKTIDVNPAHTLITDVSIGEDALLAQMHQKTRYNIGVAKRRGVEVQLEAADFGSAWELFTETSARGQFRLHPRKYYESMLATLGGTACNLFLAIGKIGFQVLAANILVDFGDTRTYLHGASSDQERNAMAPFLLHWALMRDAKARGLRWYDWWGVVPAGSPPSRPHPWFGLSRFKRGFGGEEVAVPGTYDLVLDPARYVLYRLARHASRIIRRHV